MNKKYLSVFLFSALMLGTAGTFTSCKDYDDDITNLQGQIDEVKAQVDKLQSQIESGAVITNVTSTENGVTVTLSNGNSFTLTNGKDGAAGTPGSVITINEDGYWCIDGEPTEYKAQGEQGPAGPQGPAGEDGQDGQDGADAPTIYYVPGTEDAEEGYWVKVTVAPDGTETREVTTTTWLPEGTLTAVWDTENQQLIISNVEGAEGTVVIPLATSMVTSVELVTSYTADPTSAAYPELDFTSIIEKANVFEDKGWDDQAISNAITFVKDAQKQIGGSFLVRVSPANAVLTPDMISLVNSKGENMDDFVNITGVERYNGLLTTTRAAGYSGLWTVKAQLVNYDKKSFEATTTATVGGQQEKVLFAVQVNNTADSDAARYVTSSYDLTMDYSGYTPASVLNFVVSNADNTKHVADLNNRYSFSSNKSLENYNGTATAATEYTWTGTNTPATTPVYQGTGVNTMTDNNDNRSTKDVFPAVQGEEITIALTTATTGTTVTAPSAIRAMYVTLDKKANAVESAPSEWNAWNSYQYTGLNTVVEGTSLKITIKPGAGQSIINDYIGFRVFAVNHDGTLVDPDGKAFYVKVGNPSQDWNAVATTIIPDAKTSTAPNTEKSANVTVSGLTAISGTGLTATWTTTDKNLPAGITGPVFDAYFVAGNTAVYNTTALTTFPSAATNFDKVTAIYTVPKVTNWYDLEDGRTYTATLTISDAAGFVLATMNVSMTKQLPTAAPAGYSIKTNQLDANGVYNCYLVPNTWDAPTATQGTMPMNDVFNWGTGEPSQYVVSFADAAAGATPGSTVAATAAGNATLTIQKAFIDNTKQHATTVVYDFGDISSARHNNPQLTGTAKNYTIEVGSFPTVFNCIYNNTYTWHWGTIAEIAKEHGGDWATQNPNGSYVNEAPSTDLVYGIDYTFETPGGTPFGFDQVIFGVSSRDGLYNATLYKTYVPAGASYTSLDYKEGHVISKANNEVDEYFTVAKDAQGNLYFKATQTSTETNPTANVPSTLRLTYEDMYGHTVTVDLDVTVVRR